jgi:hypothetical protein
VIGYGAGEEAVIGAFYEAGPDSAGLYRGAVLPGPGILCFNRSDSKGPAKEARSQPALFFPAVEPR